MWILQENRFRVSNESTSQGDSREGSQSHRNACVVEGTGWRAAFEAALRVIGHHAAQPHGAEQLDGQSKL